MIDRSPIEEVRQWALEYEALAKKLHRFRRHPDWLIAFKKVSASYTVDILGGGKGIPERHIAVLFELADEEFIDEGIRRGG